MRSISQCPKQVRKCCCLPVQTSKWYFHSPSSSISPTSRKHVCMSWNSIYFFIVGNDLWFQFLQGYAYILTHPGIPTVFYDHFYDWGDSMHDQIVKLVCHVTIFTYWIVLFERTIVKLLKCICRLTFESVRTFTADHLLVFWRHSQISTLQSLGRKCAWRLVMDHGVQRAESGH